MLLLGSYVGISYGVGTSDITTLLLTPFQTLNAESLPVWFSKKETNYFMSPGFTGNYLLLMWAVMGSLISMAFLCNIRAMLMKPVFQKPIDSTKDIFTAGKIPINNVAGGFWPKYMKTSSNALERLAGETGYAFLTTEERDEGLIELIYKAGSHVYLNNPESAAYYVQKDERLNTKQPPIFHFSREVIR